MESIVEVTGRVQQVEQRMKEWAGVLPEKEKYSFPPFCASQALCVLGLLFLCSTNQFVYTRELKNKIEALSLLSESDSLNKEKEAREKALQASYFIPLARESSQLTFEQYNRRSHSLGGTTS